jgi:hypothetical protein
MDMFIEKGTKDFSYNEIAESLLENNKNNGTEKDFYDSMRKRLENIKGYTEDDVNKGIELLQKHLENGMDILFKIDEPHSNSLNAILSQINTEQIYEMKLLDEMAIMESSYIDLEANFIGNLKPANSGNFELDNITLIDNLGVGINIPLEDSVVIDCKNLIVLNIEDEDLKMPYAKNTDKPITDIHNNEINKKILDRIDVQEKIEFVNNTLSAYDFEIAGRSTDVDKIEISNYENLNIVTSLTSDKISNIYDTLDKVCSKICQNDMNKYQIIEEISRQCEKDNIEIKYSNFRENKQLTLDEVKEAYGKPNNKKELDL